MHHHKKNDVIDNSLKLEVNGTTLNFSFRDEKTFREALSSISPFFENQHRCHIIIDIRNLSAHPDLDIDKMGEILYAYDLIDYAFFITTSPKFFQILQNYFRTDHLTLGNKFQSFPAY